MTKQDVIDLLRLHSIALDPKKREVVDGAIEFLLLKFREDHYNWKYERNHGPGSETRGRDPLSDGVSG